MFVVGSHRVRGGPLGQPEPPDTVVVSAAAGRRRPLTVQLARRTGATVIGLASAANHGWLREHGVVPVAHGEGAAERIRDAAPAGLTHSSICTATAMWRWPSISE